MFVVRYRWPMRGGQMTPPDVMVRGARDDQGITLRTAWNQVSSLSMPFTLFHPPRFKGHQIWVPLQNARFLLLSSSLA